MTPYEQGYALIPWSGNLLEPGGYAALREHVRGAQARYREKLSAGELPAGWGVDPGWPPSQEIITEQLATVGVLPLATQTAPVPWITQMVTYEAPGVRETLPQIAQLAAPVVPVGVAISPGASAGISLVLLALIFLGKRR